MKNTLLAGAGTGILDFPQDYFPSDGYAGIHDAMHAKVLLLVQGAVRGAVVTLELPSIRPWTLTDALRSYAAELLEVPYEHLWLVMTHDLSAPHVPTEPAKQAIHMDVLYRAVRAAAEQACQALRPVRITCCDGTCDVNSNRDMESIDGWWVGINGQGPSDKKLQLLGFNDLDGRPVAMLYSYSLKSSVLEATVMSDGKRYASGDITGRAGTKAESRLGCPVLFVMSAAGEQVPRQKANYLELDAQQRFYSVNLAEKGYDILEELSQELCDSICNTATDVGRPVADCADLCFGQITIHADGQLPYSNELPQPPVLHFEYRPAPGQDIPVWYINIGSVMLLGVKPEIVTPVFDAIKAVSPFACTMMATLVNGGQGYIAAASDYDRYTYPGLKTPFSRGTDRIFIREVSDLLCQTASQIPEQALLGLLGRQ